MMLDSSIKNLANFIKEAELTFEKKAASHPISKVKKGFFVVFLDEKTNIPKYENFPSNAIILKKADSMGIVNAAWKENDKIVIKKLYLQNRPLILDEFPKKDQESRKIADDKFVQVIAGLCGCSLPKKLKHRYHWYKKALPLPKDDFLTAHEEMITSELWRLIIGATDENTKPKLKQLLGEQPKTRVATKNGDDFYVLSKEVKESISLWDVYSKTNSGNIHILRKKFKDGTFSGLGRASVLHYVSKEIDAKLPNILVTTAGKLVAIDSGCSLLFSNNKLAQPFAGRRIFVKAKFPTDLQNYLNSYLFIKKDKTIFYIYKAQNKHQLQQFWIFNTDAFDELISVVKPEDEAIPLQNNQALTKTNKYLKLAWQLIVDNKTEGHCRGDLYEFYLTDEGINRLPFPEHYCQYNWLNSIREGVLSPKQDLLDEDMGSHPAFRLEVNQTMLRLLVLPQNLVENFITAYSKDKEQEMRFLTALQRRIAELKDAALINSSFQKYLLSKEAKIDLELYVDHYLLKFKTVGKNGLVAESAVIETKKNIFAMFDELCRSVESKLQESRFDIKKSIELLKTMQPSFLLKPYPELDKAPKNEFIFDLSFKDDFPNSEGLSKNKKTNYFFSSPETSPTDFLRPEHYTQGSIKKVTTDEAEQYCDEEPEELSPIPAPTASPQ